MFPPRQPLMQWELQFSSPEKCPKSTENDPPPFSEGWLQTCQPSLSSPSNSVRASVSYVRYCQILQFFCWFHILRRCVLYFSADEAAQWGNHVSCLQVAGQTYRLRCHAERTVTSGLSIICTIMHATLYSYIDSHESMLHCSSIRSAPHCDIGRLRTVSRFVTWFFDLRL